MLVGKLFFEFGVVLALWFRMFNLLCDAIGFCLFGVHGVFSGSVIALWLSSLFASVGAYVQREYALKRMRIVTPLR